MQFDIAQMQYIISLDSSAAVAFEDYIPFFDAAYSTLVRDLEFAGKSAKNVRGTLRLNSTSQSGQPIRYPMNRAMYLPDDLLVSSAVAHDGALVQLSHAISELSTSDFVVVDVILKRQSLLVMSDALLRSTVWFDAADGMTFVAHHDDGLVHESFKSLAQVRRRNGNFLLLNSHSLTIIIMVVVFCIFCIFCIPASSSITIASGVQGVCKDVPGDSLLGCSYASVGRAYKSSHNM
jgi:hypothetical protein